MEMNLLNNVGRDNFSSLFVKRQINKFKHCLISVVGKLYWDISLASKE